jgi:uncharacterized protein YjiS (DUF1127 family)
MQQIAEWLEKLGMSEYADRFAENKIDVSVLRHLTDQDLKDIGVPLGHRRKMLAAISEFAAAPKVFEPEPKPQETAERRQVTVMFSDSSVRQHCRRVWTPRTSARSFPLIRSASPKLCSASAGS